MGNDNNSVPAGLPEKETMPDTVWIDDGVADLFIVKTCGDKKYHADHIVSGLREGFNHWRSEAHRLEAEKAELAEIIIDMVDGEDVYDLHYNTGLSIERCDEIVHVFKMLINEHKETNND